MDRSGRSRDADPRDLDYARLNREQKRHVDCVIDVARQDRTKAVKVSGDAEFYAWPQPGGGIAWGINEGPHSLNTKRGVKR